MVRFIPMKKGNPCPICGSNSGKCREVEENVLCMTYADTDAGVSGWKYLYPTKDKLWGIYVPDCGNNGGKSWQDVYAERLTQRKRDKRDELELLGKSLSIDERSIQNRKLLLQLPLLTCDHANLEGRGLTPILIKAGLFASAAPDILVKDVSPKLAGISGDRLRVAHVGFLVPAWDAEGRVLGMQLRLRGADKNKYRWLKSQHSSKLTNGEMPITVARVVSQKLVVVG